MHQLAGRGAVVKDAGVGLFKDHDAAGLDARVGGVYGGGNEVGEAHVGDEATALFDLDHRLLAVFPLGDGDFAVKHAGIDTDVGDWLGEAECSSPRLAIFAGLGGGTQAHVVGLLFRRAALMDGR